MTLRWILPIVLLAGYWIFIHTALLLPTSRDWLHPEAGDWIFLLAGTLAYSAGAIAHYKR